MTIPKFLALVAACLAVLATTVLGGASATTTAAAPPHSIVGAWRVTVDPQPTPGGDQPPFESILTFDKAQTVSEATSRAAASAGLGAWQRTGEDTFRFVFEKYRFDSTGAYIGKTVVTEDVQLTGRNSYVGSAVTKIVTPANVVVAQFGSESSGVRITP